MLVVLKLISKHKDLVRAFLDRYVEANIIDLTKILEQLKEHDLEDLVRLYSWEVSKELKKFKFPNILSSDIWLRVLKLFRDQDIRDLLLITDSIILAAIFLKVFNDYCSGVILDENSPYLEIFKEYLRREGKTYFGLKGLKNANAVLFAFLKQKRGETPQKIKSVAKCIRLGSILAIVTSEEIFKSKGGIIYNLNLYDGTFLSVVSVRRLIKDLIFVITLKTPFLMEPFYFGDDYVAIFRSNVPAVFDPKVIVGVDRLFGLNEYEVREGLITGRDRAFIVTLGESITKRRLIFVYTSKIDNKGFRNAGFVEKETLYPVIRPADIYWPMSISEKFIVLPVKNKKLLSEEELRDTFPNTYEFLNREKDVLTSRKVSYYTFSEGPFYSLDLSEEIFSPYKVVWKRASKEFVPSLALPKLGKPPIPISGVQYIPLNNISEAYYLIALLSSKIFRDIISGYAFTGNIAIKAIRSLRIQKFDPNNEVHSKLSVLGRNLLIVDYEDKNKILKEINSVVKKLF